MPFRRGFTSPGLQGHPDNTRLDPGARCAVPQAEQPLIESRAFKDFDHGRMVNHGLHTFKLPTSLLPANRLTPGLAMPPPSSARLAGRSTRHGRETVPAACREGVLHGGPLRASGRSARLETFAQAPANLSGRRGCACEPCVADAPFSVRPPPATRPRRTWHRRNSRCRAGSRFSRSAVCWGYRDSAHPAARRCT